jgi:hypothetical protein
MPRGIPWRSPNKVLNGVPVRVRSIRTCPPVPTAGDTALVQVSLSFGAAGGSSQIVSVNPDGSWAGTITFTFSGVTLRHTKITAECLDFNGVTGVPYARYMTRPTQVFM